MTEFCHLHLHNEHSLLDGYGSSDQYAQKAKEIGHTHMALTNHGNVDGNIKFQLSCEKEGISPIHGFEAYLVDNLYGKEKKENRYHATVIAENETGWENILKLLTVAWMEGFNRRPRIDLSSLIKYSEGMIIMSACSSSFITHPEGEKILIDLKNSIPEGNLFLEVMPHIFAPQVEVNKLCYNYSRKYNIPIVATNDCHYVNKEDSKLQEVLLAVQRQAKWKDPDRWKFSFEGLYVRTAEEMYNEFQRQGVFSNREILKYLSNTMLIAEKCKFKIPERKVELPLVPGFEGRDDSEVITEICEKGFEKKIVGKVKGLRVYRERLDEELSTIINLGFSRYFLIVWELVDWCKKNDIMVGPGRGSVGGSLVAYLMGITGVDPIKYELVFARFISPARIDLPDIDMDFEDIKRPLIRKHLEDVYGENNVCSVSTFSSMKGRGALRDVSRVFDIPLSDVNAASKSIVQRSGGDFRADFTIEDAFATFEDGRRFKRKYPEVADIASRMEGQVRGFGQHAAAIVISKEDLREGKRGYLRKGKDDEKTINWDKFDIEHVGLMKLDILGLNALTVLDKTKKLVKERRNITIDWDEITLDDPKVFEEFSKGNNVGTFQVGSLGLIKFCRELGIEDFNMLVHATALYRPGTLRSGMTSTFQLRKTGREKFKHLNEHMESITKDTYGIILYQEQVMRFMYDLGGLPWKTADTVRKVMSKTQGVEQFMKFRDMFAEGCEARGTLDRETAAKLWSELANFGSYGFNKSHAVEYSIITYWDQYCKVYYPEEFMCASLTYGSEDKKDLLVKEAHRMGIDVVSPKAGISKAKDWVVGDNKLYAPYIEVNGIGETTAKKCEEQLQNAKRNGEIPSVKLSKKILESLDAVGAFTDKELDYKKLDGLMSFSLNRDPAGEIRTIVETLKENGLEIGNIADIDFKVIDKTWVNYFGLITEIKFGYRGKLDTYEKKIGASGLADNLGGVYGNFQDHSDFAMIVFNSDLYLKKKDRVEHCSGDFAVAKVNRPMRTTSIHCSEIWFDDELRRCDIGDMGIKAIKRRRTSFKSQVENCSDCALRQECSKPVTFSPGFYNIAIVGEAPVTEEDESGIPLYGRSGKEVWKELSRYNLDRKMFHVTNVVKCYPSKTKTPTKRHIAHCSKWIDEELKETKPIIILAFGNTPLKFFTEKESGITDLTGTTEWNEKYRAWICWCIHPASVLYNRENYSAFQEGIKNFYEKIKNLGL